MVCQSNEAKADAKTEIKMLKMFSKHPNIVTLLGATAQKIQIPGQRRESAEVQMLFPMFKNGTVFDTMWKALG